LRSTADGGLVMFDGVPLPAGGARSYEVFVKNGDIATSGFDPFAWLAAHGNDLTVAVTARTGSATGPRPDLLFSLKTAIQTTTRREILCDTRRFVRIKAWQKVPQEEHLICEYHLDFWLDGNGQPWGLEFAPVLTQHWWVADPFGVTQTKERQTYDAVVRYGTTVLDTRTRLDHAYYCRWASLRPQDDAQHARKHWIGLGLSQMPTVRVQYDDSSLKRMMKAGYIPPLRLGVAYPSDRFSSSTSLSSGGMESAYTPLTRNGHRQGINGTGGHIGRGIWGGQDAVLVCRQSQAAATAELAWRRSRVMAQAGLSVYHHVRDHRTVSGVNGGTDTTNRLIPQTFRKAATLGISQNYTGLGAHCVYAKNGVEKPSGLTVLAHNAPVGGTGGLQAYDNAHAHNYSAPMAFLEGEAYLGDAVVSQFNMTSYYDKFNINKADQQILYGNIPGRVAAQSIPSASAGGYGTTPFMTGQERALAWSLNMLNNAYRIRADSHPETPFIVNFIKNLDLLFSDSFSYYPESHRTRGGLYVKSEDGGRYSQWMAHWQGLAAYDSARLYDFLPENARGMTGFEEGAFLAARLVINAMASHPYSIGEYQHLWGTGNDGLAPLPNDEWPYAVDDVPVASNVFTATPPVGMQWRNGDKVRISATDGRLADLAIPSGLSTTTLYYMVNVSGNSFQLSLTEGGGAVTGIANASNVSIMATLADYQISPIGPAGTYYWPNDDGYHPKAYALFEQAIGEGHPDITTEIKNAGRAFFAPKVADYSDLATWNYDGSNITETD
jgi:hypothetical protein